MSDKILRQKLIRLAHANPSLRKEILPLLKQADTSNTAVSAGPFKVHLQMAAPQGYSNRLTPVTVVVTDSVENSELAVSEANWPLFQKLVAGNSIRDLKLKVKYWTED